MKIIVSTMKGILSTNIDFISMAKRNLQNCIPSESKHEHFKLHQQDLRFMIWTIWIWSIKIFWNTILKIHFDTQYPNFWFMSLQTGFFQLIGYVMIHLFLAKPLEDLNALKIAFQVYFFREIEQMVFCCHDFTGENYTHWCHGECLYEQTRNRTHDWSNFPYETHKILHAKNKYNFLLFSLSLFFASLLFCIFLLQL